MSLWSTLGKIATVGANVVTGGTAGTVLKIASGVLGGSGSSAPAPAPQAMPGGYNLNNPVKPLILPGSPDSIKVSGKSIGLLQGYNQVTATGYYSQPGTAVACQTARGTHLNRTGYHLKDGTYVAPNSRCVKNRRRNPLNPRALSRAMGRLSSAKKAIKALDRFEIHGRRRGR